METLFIWSLKTSGILIVLFTAYYFFFRNNTAFQIRRILLLVLLILCSIAPLLRFDVSETEPTVFQQALNTKQLFVSPFDVSSAPTSTVPIPEVAAAKSFEWNWFQITQWAYSIGIIVSFLFFLLEIAKVFYWKFGAKKEIELGKNVLSHPAVKSPFSFGRWIFIPSEEKYSEDIWNIVSRHEQAHLERNHTIDLLIAKAFQIILWYNPIIYLLQKELSNIHEAQADETVLEKFQLKAYAQVLMQIGLKDQHLPIGHSFAVISSLSKRLKLMKTHKTRFQTTLLSIVALFTLSVGIIGWSSLTAQETKRAKDSDSQKTELISEKQLEILNMMAKEEGYPKVSSREEALEIMKKDMLNMSSSFFYSDKIPSRLISKKEKLQQIYPDKDIRFQYLNAASSLDYQGTYFLNNSPLYIGKLSTEDKEELVKLSLSDSSRANNLARVSNTFPVYRFSVYEYKEEYIASIMSGVNYIMFYEITKEVNSEIYNEIDVDVKPEPVGGIEAFQRAIALDIKIPESINKQDLPEYINFNAVIYGGRQIGNVNLLTEIKGSDKSNKDVYLFFGDIMEEIQNKTRQFYTWKRGIKDNQQVKVRVKISIPTKYML